MIFDKTPPPSKTSPLVDDDLDEEETIREIEKKNLENIVEDETLKIDEIVNIKESRNHPLENNVNEALGDESWIIVMQEESKQFIANDVWELVPQPRNMIIIGTKWVFRNKLDENGACVFSYRWRLDELAYGIPLDGPYQTDLPPIEDIISSIRIDREGQVRRIRHEKEIDVLEYQFLSRKIVQTLKPLEEIIRENVFCLGAWLILPYGMLLTRLFKFIMDEYPELSNDSYVLHNHVMNPLAAQLGRKVRRDRGTRRGHPSTSSSTFDQPSSSHLNDDDDDENNEGTSRASTPSPIRYVNSLTNEVPQLFQNPPNIDPNMEPFYTRQTKIINLQVQLRDEQRGGLRSIGKGFRKLWKNLKKM
ncbi:retrovirus-related pol polyprotein from transposon TNT 1-94 [Tanacetum coccineum]